MIGTIAWGLLARFIVYYLVWPIITVVLGAMGLAPDWFWTLLLGPNWKETVPTYLTQDTGRWVAVIAAIVFGLGFFFYALRGGSRAAPVLAREGATDADLLRAEADLEKQWRLALKEKRAGVSAARHSPVTAAPASPLASAQPAQTTAPTTTDVPATDGRPLTWDFTKAGLIFGFNEAHDGSMLVGVIRILGNNETPEPLTKVNSYVEPQLTDGRLQLRFNTRDGVIDTKDAHIPAGPGVEVSLVYFLAPSDSRHQQGISVDEYLDRYGGFRFVFEWAEGGSYSTNVSFAQVRDMLKKEEEKWSASRPKNPPEIRKRSH